MPRISGLLRNLFELLGKLLAIGRAKLDKLPRVNVREKLPESLREKLPDFGNPRVKRYTIAGGATAGAAAIALACFAGTASASQPDQAPHKPDSSSTASSDSGNSRSGSGASGSGGSADNLDGWIHQAQSIMQKKHIPGSYQSIKRNVIRESGGDPNIVNTWDVNAQKGTPSKGLLQMIQPTFDQYHVNGTKDSITDPVANIVAACNYAADKYGSMNNVDSAY